MTIPTLLQMKTRAFALWLIDESRIYNAETEDIREYLHAKVDEWCNRGAVR